MPTNERRKSKARSKAGSSAQSRGREKKIKGQAEQIPLVASSADAGDSPTSVSSPKRSSRAAEATAAPRGETERPFKGWPAGRPRGRLLDAWHATYSTPATLRQ